MIVNYNENIIVLKHKGNSDIKVIKAPARILSFALSDSYCVICVDWEDLADERNVFIYDAFGNYLYTLDNPQNKLYKGYYSSIGLKSEQILVAQSFDFKYEIDLMTRKFLSQEYTK